MRLGLGAILLGALGLVPAVWGTAGVSVAECTAAWNGLRGSDPVATANQISVVAGSLAASCTASGIAIDKAAWAICCTWKVCDKPTQVTAGATTAAYQVGPSGTWNNYGFDGHVICADGYGSDGGTLSVTCPAGAATATLTGVCKQECATGLFSGSACTSSLNTGKLKVDKPGAFCATAVCDNANDIATCCKAPDVACKMTGCAEDMCTKTDGYCWYATCEEGYHFARKEQACKADPTDEENDDACFPADGQVELQGGNKVPMSALKVGDHVRVGPSEFSEVYMFTHKDAEVKVRKHGVTVW
tara:strand:+ start:4094 stop:4999 length:906 start_codon:yes stop_codon:yes gene_type:complete